jgi:hypothetical protein
MALGPEMGFLKVPPATEKHLKWGTEAGDHEVQHAIVIDISHHSGTVVGGVLSALQKRPVAIAQIDI